jgi:hypothetical protein
MPAPGNPRATANRRVMNNVHARLAALRRDLETGTVSGNPLVLSVILECLQTLDAGMATDLRHQQNENAVQPPDTRGYGRGGNAPLGRRIVTRSINIGHTLQGEDAATVTVEQELHSLRRLADGYHQRLAKIEAYLGDEAGFQEMDATQ